VTKHVKHVLQYNNNHIERPAKDNLLKRPLENSVPKVTIDWGICNISFQPNKCKLKRLPILLASLWNQNLFLGQIQPSILPMLNIWF